MKNEPFVSGSEEKLASNNMITALTIATALHHVDHEQEVIIQTDDSNHTSAAVVSHRDDEGV
jgi:hypothetical protein